MLRVIVLLLAGLPPSPAAAGEGEAPLAISGALLPPLQGVLSSSPALQALASPLPERSDFKREAASSEARELAAWVIDSADNQSKPFVIVDKTAAKVFVFHPDGRLWGAAPALVGMAVGDDSAPGIGERKLSDVRPEERTTPAGRFVAALGRNIHGVEILWVDYDLAISMHRVVPGTLKERRHQRLASLTPMDNRITYGCINVPIAFFVQIVRKAFLGTAGIVYILPETRLAQTIFGSYEIRK